MKKILVLGVLVAGITALAQVTLVKDQMNEAEIIVDLNAPRPVVHAAKELQLTVKMITGVRLPILNAPLEGKKTHIFLISGDAPQLKKYRTDLEKLAGNDGYAVRTAGRNVYLFASTPAGVVNGVHRLIYKNSDLIWARPFNECAVYTQLKDFSLTQTDYIDIPEFILRGWGVNRSRTVFNEDYDLWCSRTNCNFTGSQSPPILGRRMDYGFPLEFGGGHNMVGRWLPIKEFGEKHPDYYMLVDGKRQVTRDAILCHTNQNMIRDFIANALKIIKDIPPYYSTINIMMEDTNTPCECGECEKPLILPDGSTIDKSDEAFHSTQFYMFMNQVAEAIYKQYPNLQIKTFAYYFTAIPPKVKLFKTINVSFCPYIRNDKESLQGKSNAKWKKRLEGWAAMTPNVILREYYYSAASFPRPIANIAAEDLRFANQLGVRKLYSESSWADDPRYKTRGIFPETQFWDMTAPEHWTMNQLFWDPKQDPDKLRNEYIRRVYREGAPGVQEFYKLIRDSWLNDPSPSVYNDDYKRSMATYIINKDLLKPCREALDKAAKQVVDPRSKDLLEKLRRTFEEWVLLAPSKESSRFDVPKAEIRSFPDFDFERGVWTQASILPPLSIMGRQGDMPSCSTTVKLIQNGRDLYLGFYCYDPKPENLFALKPGQPYDTWPKGDHLELFFANEKDGYYHLAFDFNGNKYDAILTDKSWNADWDVKTKTVKDGWLAVVKIPITSINFPLAQNNCLKALIYRCKSNNGKPEHSSWNGGVVHSPDSFGELIFAHE